MVKAARTKQWYQSERDRVRRWRSALSAAGRDIGRLPPVVDPKRKQACRDSLKLFAKTYFPETFDLPFSEDHDQVIEIMERAVLEGGLFVLAMPRGSGKTTLCVVAALWAVLYGYHNFVLLVGATAVKARDMLRTIKTELRTNELLLADFPEVCYPIARLQGINNRSAGQTFGGKPTLMGWTKDEVVLPTIAGSPASSAIIGVAGILTASRGGQFKRPDGKTARPSLVIPDDPQTDRSAKSPKQCDTREEIIKSGLLRSAGPGKKITMIIPCTVIATGDLADRMLDRQLNPQFNGLRTKTLYAFPADMKLWEDYAEKRADSFRQGNEGREATAFYKKNRKAMDAGAKVAWPDRVEEGDLSALQTAMNVYLSDPRAFGAEYQNEPVIVAAAAAIKLLTAAEITQKLNHLDRGALPQFVSIVNAKIDVQQDVLFWLIAGWSGDFDGAVLDYGTWPEQDRAYFTLTSLARTIGDEIPDAASLEEQLYQALDTLVDQLLAREFRRADGAILKIGRLQIDASYETKTVKKFCRQSKHAAQLLASHGRGIGAKDRPISQWAKKEGERRGEEWVIGRATDVRGLRHLTFDTNHWKTETQKRFSTAAGGRGSLAIFGKRPGEHRMFADHNTAEKPVMVAAKGREVIEWQLPPNKPDNHWNDCLVGCAVDASIEGAAVLAGKARPPRPPRPSRRKRVSYIE